MTGIWRLTFVLILGISAYSSPPRALASEQDAQPSSIRETRTEDPFGVKRGERHAAYFAEDQATWEFVYGVPEWVHDVIWYYVDVPRFRNGDPSNDSPGTPPWGEKRSPIKLPSDASLYGGDLQGLREKLPYLKELGVNGLILNGVFPEWVILRDEDDLLKTLHVRDSVAVAGSGRKISGETLDRDTWRVTESDRLFLDVVEEARGYGFRVIVEYPHPTVPNLGCTGPPLYFYDYCDFVWDMNRHWLRIPNVSGHGEGIDGWANSNVYGSAPSVFSRWRRRLKAVNPDCVLVGLNQLIHADDRMETGKHADALLYNHPGETIIRFFQRSHSINAASLLKDWPTQRERAHECWSVALWQGWGEARLVNCLETDPYGGSLSLQALAKNVITPDAISRWRLATAFQLFVEDNYVIRFGEEVGLVDEGPPWYPEPMQWDDLSEQPTQDVKCRKEMLQFIQSINGLRDRYAALRRGEFRVELADDERKLLAFSRSLSGERVTVVMNYGDQAQLVKLELGQPGDSVDLWLLSPVDPSCASDRPASQPVIPQCELRIAEPDGGMLFELGPSDVRVAVISDRG